MVQPPQEEKNFYDEYSLFTNPRIQQMILSFNLAAQPDFIKVSELNQEPVAFLGEEPLDTKDFIQKFYRVDQMVIPEFAQMVNPDKLQEYLDLTKDGKHIKPHKDLFFNTEPLQESVLMNVCGMVSNHTYQDMHFHHCQNHIHKIFHTTNPDGGTCDLPHLTSYIDEENQLRHKPVIFFVSKENLNKTDRIHDGAQKWTIQKRLQVYFKDKHFASKKSHSVVRFKKKRLKGIFLIPMIATDQRIIYYCVLNLDGKSNQGKTVKTTLNHWLGTIAKYSDDPDSQEIFIEGNDSTFLYIERWSIFLGRDAEIEVVNSERILKPEILARKIS